MTDLTVTFRSGQVSPVTDVRDCGLFRTGLAHRADGFCRCVFLDSDGVHHYDDWLDSAPIRSKLGIRAVMLS